MRAVKYLYLLTIAAALNLPASGQETTMPVPTIQAFLEADRPMVIAHRGFSGKAPENTLVAIEQAIELGADMVEVDVTLTADGHVVVIHDETLDRTTNGRGPVLETSLEAIRSLDAGAWFDARFAGEKVPTLSEVLELTRDRILLNVEIKHEAVGEGAEGGIAQKVDTLVRGRGMTETVIVSSFDPRPLGHLRELGSEIATASLYAEELHRGMRPSEVIAQVGAAAFNVSGRHLDEAMLADARQNGIKVSVYTINEEADMERLLALGVGALFTDRPDRLLELLRRRPAGDGRE